MARGSGTENDVLVIGLGRFGAAAALELRRLGHKVTAIEKDGFLAEKFLGRISHVGRSWRMRCTASVVRAIMAARMNDDT